VLGREWPQSKREATELINELQLEPVLRALENTPDPWVQASGRLGEMGPVGWVRE
jgi:hypothetical protein